MAIRQLVADEAPELSAVQSRLTVAGITMSALFFAGTFAIGLYNQLHLPDRRDFRHEFAQVLVPLALGAVLTACAIGGLLLCQQIRSGRRGWLQSRRSWFAVATVYLYIALTQALSAGTSEVVYGVSLANCETATLFCLVSTLAWLFLLFAAPFHLIWTWWPHFERVERVVVVTMYAVALAIVFSANAMVYVTRAEVERNATAFTSSLLWQTVQPLTWSTRWGGHTLRSLQCSDRNDD